MDSLYKFSSATLYPVRIDRVTEFQLN